MEPQPEKRHIAIFASGNGTNAENITAYFNNKNNQACEVALIVCNKPDAMVLQRAKKLGVPSKVISKAQINDQETMLELLEGYSIDLIVLAGFLLMIPPFLLEHYRDRIINIHPSLLPKYGGKGMFGHHVHEAVVAAHEKETGITVHIVDERCDEGRIIFQASTPLSASDTPDDVERKVHSLEREHFPRVIEQTLASLPNR